MEGSERHGLQLAGAPETTERMGMEAFWRRSRPKQCLREWHHNEVKGPQTPLSKNRRARGDAHFLDANTAPMNSISSRPGLTESYKEDLTCQASEGCAAVQALLQVAGLGIDSLGTVQWREIRTQLALLILRGCLRLGVDGCAGLGPRLRRELK